MINKQNNKSREDENNSCIMEWLKQHPIQALIYGCLIILIVIPLIIAYLIINNNIVSQASNDGWASFWGSYLGGFFGGIGTLVAVIVTTKQARKHQIENMNETKEMQKQSQHQIKINNLNEKIHDYHILYKKVNKMTISLVLLANEIKDEDDLANVMNKKYLNQLLEWKDIVDRLSTNPILKNLEIDFDSAYSDFTSLLKFKTSTIEEAKEKFKSNILKFQVTIEMIEKQILEEENKLYQYKYEIIDRQIEE